MLDRGSNRTRGMVLNRRRLGLAAGTGLVAGATLTSRWLGRDEPPAPACGAPDTAFTDCARVTTHIHLTALPDFAYQGGTTYLDPEEAVARYIIDQEMMRPLAGLDVIQAHSAGYGEQQGDGKVMIWLFELDDETTARAAGTSYRRELAGGARFEIAAHGFDQGDAATANVTDWDGEPVARARFVGRLDRHLLVIDHRLPGREPPSRDHLAGVARSGASALACGRRWPLLVPLLLKPTFLDYHYATLDGKDVSSSVADTRVGRLPATGLVDRFRGSYHRPTGDGYGAVMFDVRRFLNDHAAERFSLAYSAQTMDPNDGDGVTRRWRALPPELDVAAGAGQTWTGRWSGIDGVGAAAGVLWRYRSFVIYLEILDSPDYDVAEAYPAIRAEYRRLGPLLDMHAADATPEVDAATPA